MPFSTSLMPNFDVTVHVVLDDFGKAGRAYRETDEAQASFETVVDDLLTGQLNNPVRVVAFNTSEGWSRDVSEDVAREVVRRVSAMRTASRGQFAAIRRELCRRGRACACRKRSRVTPPRLVGTVDVDQCPIAETARICSDALGCRPTLNACSKRFADDGSCAKSAMSLVSYPSNGAPLWFAC